MQIYFKCTYLKKWGNLGCNLSVTRAFYNIIIVKKAYVSIVFYGVHIFYYVVYAVFSLFSSHIRSTLSANLLVKEEEEKEEGHML